jgi:hypothetical protein
MNPKAHNPFKNYQKRELLWHDTTASAVPVFIFFVGLTTNNLAHILFFKGFELLIVFKIL